MHFISSCIPRFRRYEGFWKMGMGERRTRPGRLDRHCGKIAFDNHLEGSSIERYSEVAETLNNLLGRGGASAATLRWD
jgi:hypothetical protein